MIILGITGSIGMGKSTVGALLEHLSVPVHEADEAVHKLLSDPLSPARPIIAREFPVYKYRRLYDKKTGRINRKTLGDLIFEDDEKRQILESILHPLVQNAQDEFLFKQRRLNRKFAVLDIPLLFETGAEQRVDHTICVTAPYFLQRKRVLSRPGMSEEKFESILKRQLPDIEKCTRADYVVRTSKSRAELLQDLRNILKELTFSNYNEKEKDVIKDYPYRG